MYNSEEDWHMPIESSQNFIILFRVNQVFTFYHFIAKCISYRCSSIGQCLKFCCLANLDKPGLGKGLKSGILADVLYG